MSRAMIKPLIISSVVSLQHELESALKLRGHSCTTIYPAHFDHCESAAGESTIVVDIDSVYSAQASELQRFTDAQFERVIAFCRAHDLPLLMLSHGGVFGSGSTQRYRESDIPETNSTDNNPHKILCARESSLRAQLSRYIILRTGPLIAARGENMLTRLLQRIRAGGRVNVASAPRFCPTPQSDVARVICGIIEQLDCGAEPWGAYHYQSADATNCYEFAEAVLAAGQYWNLEQTQLHNEPGAVCPDVLPLLHCQCIRDTFGIQQLSWRRAIPGLLKQIFEGEKA